MSKKWGKTVSKRFKVKKTIDQAKVIAVDLNGTLASGRGKNPEEWKDPEPDAEWALKTLKDKGYIVCINSVVGDESAIEEWLKQHDLLQYVDYINESPAQPEGSSDKLNAVAMVDDRGWHYDGDWKRTLSGLLESGILEKSMKVAIKRKLVQRITKRLDKGQYLDDKDDNSIWVLSTGDLDRDGETVDPEGIDFGEFDINPCVLDNHNTDGGVTDVVLGKIVRHWLDDVGEGTKWPQVGGEKRSAQLGEIEWNTSTQKGRDAQKMAKAGQLNGGSISFVPLDEPRKNASDGNHYGKVKLLEFTLCPVGSNPSAVRVKGLRKSADTQRVMEMANGYWNHPSATALREIKQTMQGMSEQDANAVARKLLQGSGITWHVEEDKESSINEVYQYLLTHRGKRLKGSNRYKLKAPLRRRKAGGMAKLEPNGVQQMTVLGPTGTPLSPMNYLAAQRMVERGDAEVVDSSTIKLTHEPSSQYGHKNSTESLASEVAEKAKRRRMKRAAESFTCPRCQYVDTSGDDDKLVCPDCGLDWSDPDNFKSAAIDEAMKDCGVPHGMKSAVKRIAMKRMRKNKGKTMRKCWVNKRLKTAWLLKSEGDPLTPEEEEQLTDMGVEEVQVEDEAPESFEDWAEEEMAEDDHEKASPKIEVYEDDQDPNNTGWAWRVTWADGHQESGEADNEADGKRQANSAISYRGDKALDNADKVEDIAEDVADRSEEIVLAGAEEGAAISAAMVEGCVPLEMQPAVKAIVRRRMKRKANRKSVSVGDTVMVRSGTGQGETGVVDSINGDQASITDFDGRTFRESIENLEVQKSHRRKSFSDDNSPLGLKAAADRAIVLMEASTGQYYLQDGEGNRLTGFGTFGSAEQAAQAGKVDGYSVTIIHKSFGDDNQPLGLKALKHMIKAIEEAMKGPPALHKSEQPHVIDAGERALKLLKAALRRSYKDSGEEDPEALKKGMRFTCKGKRYVCKSVDDEVIEAKTGEFFPEDDIENGPFDTEKEARRSADGKSVGEPSDLKVVEDEGSWGITDFGKLIETGYASREEAERDKREMEAEAKSKSRKRLKRLSKADTDVVKSAVETLESMAEGNDLPKHLKGTVRGMAEDFKSLCKSPDIVDDPDAEVPDEILERFEKALTKGDAAANRFSDKLFRQTGIRN